MAKIIRLTEADLTKIVERVIKEQNVPKPKPIKISATEGSSPEVSISLEKGAKVLKVHYESGLNPDEKFVVTTNFPATIEPKKVYAIYSGKNVFLLSDKKIPAKVIGQL